jgi:hypothetical protein
MISLLIGLIILVVIVYIANILVNMLALPPQVKTIIYVVIALIALLWILSYLGVYSFPLR